MNKFFKKTHFLRAAITKNSNLGQPIKCLFLKIPSNISSATKSGVLLKFNHLNLSNSKPLKRFVFTWNGQTVVTTILLFGFTLFNSTLNASDNPTTANLVEQ